MHLYREFRITNFDFFKPMPINQIVIFLTLILDNLLLRCKNQFKQNFDGRFAESIVRNNIFIG